jgi:hypothetical protein
VLSLLRWFSELASFTLAFFLGLKCAHFAIKGFESFLLLKLAQVHSDFAALVLAVGTFSSSARDCSITARIRASLSAINSWTNLANSSPSNGSIGTLISILSRGTGIGLTNFGDADSLPTTLPTTLPDSPSYS